MNSIGTHEALQLRSLDSGNLLLLNKDTEWNLVAVYRCVYNRWNFGDLGQLIDLVLDNFLPDPGII